MKKIITSMVLFAAAAMVFVSCQKEQGALLSEPVTITFSSENPVSKTHWDGQTILWSENDAVRVALMIGDTWYQDANGAKLYQSSKLTQNLQTATFSVNDFNSQKITDGGWTGAYQFYGLSPASAEDVNFGKTTSKASIGIPATQVLSSDTFDKSADILWGKAVNTYSELPSSDVSMVWNRVVAHAYISLNDINGITAGELVKSVTLTAQDGTALTGDYELHMATGEFTAKSSVSNKVVLSSSGGVAVSGNDLTLWACINPCNVTFLNVVVDTDKAVYTIDKTNLDLDFLVNKRNILPIDMSGADRVEKAAAEDYSGTYAILAVKGEQYYYLTNVDDGASTKRLKSQEVAALPSEGASLPASYVWNIIRNEDGTYLLQSAENSYYLHHTGGNSCVLEESKDGVVSLTIEKSEEIYSIYYYNGTDKRMLQKANNVNYNYFAFYTPGQCGDLYLIPAKAVLVPSIETTETEVAVDAAGGRGSFSYSVTNPVSNQNVNASTNDGWISDIVVDASSVSFSVAENTQSLERKGVITLSYEGAEDVTVTVTQAAKPSQDANYYVKVTTAPADWSGQYLIVCEEANIAMTGSGTAAADIKNPTVVEITQNGIQHNSAMEAISVTISPVTDGYLIVTHSGYGVYCTDASTSFSANSKLSTYGKYPYTISLLNGEFEIKRGTKYMMYNKSNKMFGFYTSKTQTAVQLYKLQD